MSCKGDQMYNKLCIRLYADVEWTQETQTQGTVQNVHPKTVEDNQGVRETIGVRDT